MALGYEEMAAGRGGWLLGCEKMALGYEKMAAGRGRKDGSRMRKDGSTCSTLLIFAVMIAPLAQICWVYCSKLPKIGGCW